MANIKIKDTGYANTSANGTQETRANGGNAVDLKSVSVNINQSFGLDNSMNPARYSQSEINYVGFSNRNIVITGKIDRGQANDINTIQYIKELGETKGLKLLYYSDNADGFDNIINALGSTTTNGTSTANTYGIGSSTKFILCRVDDYRFTQRAGSTAIDFTLSLVATNE